MRAGIERVSLLCVGLLVAVSGCGYRRHDHEHGDATPHGGATASPPSRQARNVERVEPSHCQPGLPSCRTTKGRIVYVERVDPDGDGDAHFVVIDPQGITLPGLTAIDVRKGLRPHPLPGLGDLISAAGPVQTGSYGQDQIHALELHVAGASGAIDM